MATFVAAIGFVVCFAAPAVASASTAPAIAGHIYLCSPSGDRTKTEIPAGSLAVMGPQTVASQPNPLSSTAVEPGTYTMTAASPSGFVLVACGGSASVDAGGATASQSVVVSNHHCSRGAVGVFYVVPAPPVPLVTTTSTLPPPTIATTTTSTTTTTAPPSFAGTVSPPAAPTTSPPPVLAASGSPAPTSGVQAAVATKPASSSTLASTGVDTVPVLLGGLVLVGLGWLLVNVSRRRSQAFGAAQAPPAP